MRRLTSSRPDGLRVRESLLWIQSLFDLCQARVVLQPIVRVRVRGAYQIAFFDKGNAKGEGNILAFIAEATHPLRKDWPPDG
jgi:hypothetical protein